MNGDEAREIIEAILKAGEKSPGLFDLPKILGVKNKLEACTSIADTLAILEENRSLICKSFGISDILFNDGVGKLKALV